MAAGLPRIVHVSADFPDPIDPGKTPVIRSLLELTRGQFAHRVVSLNRRAPGIGDLLGRRTDQPAAFEWGNALVYRAPPRGILHWTMLRRLGRRLARDLAASPPDLLVGHKLTIEGLAVAEAARLLQVPYAITIQGNSDGKILAARPDLRRRFALVFHEAALVFAFSPWSLSEVERRLGPRTGASVLVPCPTDLDTPVVPIGAGQGLFSAFHLRHHGNKNLRSIASALRLLRARGEAAGFTLAGGGDEADTARCLKELRGISNVSLIGLLDRPALQAAMNSALGFVLPSHRESFGLVFIEALFAGIPVIYPKDRAIAGWFENAPFAIPVDPGDPAALASALARLIEDEIVLKQSLADWQQSDHARQFTRPKIAATFAKALHNAAAHPAAQLQKGLR